MFYFEVHFSDVGITKGSPWLLRTYTQVSGMQQCIQQLQATTPLLILRAWCY